MKNLTATVFVHRMSKYIYCKRVSIVYVQSGLVQPSINYFFLILFTPNTFIIYSPQFREKASLKITQNIKLLGKKRFSKGWEKNLFKKICNPECMCIKLNKFFTFSLFFRSFRIPVRGWSILPQHSLPNGLPLQASKVCVYYAYLSSEYKQ